MLIARFEPGGMMELARRIGQRGARPRAPVAAGEIGDRAA
jgi:hypothetical protein